jgi:hypothetical protein
MRNSVKAAIGILAVLGAAAPVSVAAAATTTSSTTTPSSGPIKVWVTPSSTNTSTKNPGKILITGAIADYGTVISTNAAKKPTAKGAYKLLRLKQGTILVNGTQLNKALTTGKPSTANTSNCSFIFGATAPVTLSGGTGAYVGISGTVTITATFAAIGPKTKSGDCTMKTSAKPLSTYSSISGSGTVNFS